MPSFAVITRKRFKRFSEDIPSGPRRWRGIKPALVTVAFRAVYDFVFFSIALARSPLKSMKKTSHVIFAHCNVYRSFPALLHYRNKILFDCFPIHDHAVLDVAKLQTTREFFHEYLHETRRVDAMHLSKLQLHSSRYPQKRHNGRQWKCRR